MSDLIIQSPIPSRVLVLNEDVQNRVNEWVTTATRISALPCTCADEFASFNDCFDHIVALEKELENQRVSCKAPALEFGRLVDAAVKPAAAMLAVHKQRIGAIAKAWEISENVRIEKIRAEEREAARQAQLANEAAARAAQVPVEIVDPDAFPGDAPVFVTPPAPAPVLIQTYATPLVKSSVKSQPKKKLVIVDASLIPRELGGAILMVPDEAVITKLWKAGMRVEGTDYVDDGMTFSSKGLK